MEKVLLIVAATAIAFGGLVAGFISGRNAAEPGIAWQWDSSHPGIELIPYRDMETWESGTIADLTLNSEDARAVQITVRHWDVRYREGVEGEGFMLYDGDTLFYTGPLESLWFRPVAYHPPEKE